MRSSQNRHEQEERLALRLPKLTAAETSGGLQQRPQVCAGGPGAPSSRPVEGKSEIRMAAGKARRGGSWEKLPGSGHER